MAKNKKKYYVIWAGSKTGIFDSWKECQKHIKGFAGAKYKSFKTLQDAKKAFADTYENAIDKKSPLNQVNLDQFGSEIQDNSISVDAACSGNPGKMEYRGVETFSKIELFRQGPYEAGTNNIGEFLALVHALALFQNRQDVTIYTDSRTAMAWVRNKKAKTMVKRSTETSLIFEMIDRAEDWLKKNTFRNPIAKWNTKKWGEIPADFGRK